MLKNVPTNLRDYQTIGKALKKYNKTKKYLRNALLVRHYQFKKQINILSALYNNQDF